MGWTGILAAGIAGGAKSIADQAAGDIEQKRKLDIAAEMAKIEEQMRMRLAESQRQGDWDFKVRTAPQAREIARDDTLAKERATTDALVERETDSRVIAAQDAAAARRLEQTITAETARLNDPRIAAAEKAAAERKLEQAKAEYAALTPGVVDRAKQVSAASRSPNEGVQGDLLRLQLDEARNNAKIPAAVKTAVSALQKEAEQIGAAITKAMAEGMAWEPTKNPAQSDLMDRQKINAAKIMRLLAPYMPESKAGGATGADPLGILGAAPGGAGTTTRTKTDAAPAGRTSTLAGDGLLDGVAAKIKGAVDGMRKEGSAVTALREKIAAGSPLTSDEQAMARRYGLAQ